MNARGICVKEYRLQVGILHDSDTAALTLGRKGQALYIITWSLMSFLCQVTCRNVISLFSFSECRYTGVGSKAISWLPIHTVIGSKAISTNPARKASSSWLLEVRLQLQLTLVHRVTQNTQVQRNETSWSSHNARCTKPPSSLIAELQYALLSLLDRKHRSKLTSVNIWNFSPPNIGTLVTSTGRDFNFSRGVPQRWPNSYCQSGLIANNYEK